MRKRTTLGLVVLTSAVMGSLWAHDVATTEATASALSDQIVQVEQEKRAAVMEGGDLRAMLDKARAEIDEQEALVEKVRGDWEKEKQAKIRARADLSVQDEKVAALREQVMELQEQVDAQEKRAKKAEAQVPEKWHGFTVGEVVVCPASDWIVSVDTTAEGIQWGACM